jgi:hypothetical protein
MLRISLAAGLAILALGVSAPADAQRRADRVRPFTPAWAAPQLDVYPHAGRPGERVVISGARFGRGARVYYGHQPMRVLEREERRIVAVIPRGARGDRFIYVVDRTGRARTFQLFALHRRGDYYDHYDDDYDPYDDRWRDWGSWYPL